MGRGLGKRFFFGFGFVVWVLSCLFPLDARAFVAPEYQNPIERALGLEGMAAISLLRPTPESDGRWQIEAGERFLFGIADLKTTELRVVTRHRVWGALLSSVMLTTPVGGLTGAAIEPFLWDGRVGFGVEIGISRLAIDELQGQGSATLGADAAVRLTDALCAGYRIENVPLLGAADPGADTVLYLAFVRGVGGVGRIDVTRTGEVGVSLASWVRLGQTVQAAFGYDGAAETIHTAVCLSVSGASLSVGGSVHPVLGVSKSVFVSWGR